MGSADWMPRNLDRRVEVVVPIDQPEFQRRLMSLLQTYLEDHRQVWEMQGDGSYVQRSPRDENDVGCHKRLMRDPWGLDRSESRYHTSEYRAAILQPTPQPHDHQVHVNGRRRKGGKRRISEG
jgi:hypothetical protein